jgi:hypothetical protein
MKVHFIILCTAGWVWTGLLFGYLAWKLTRKDPRGFEVQTPEQKD